MATRDSTLPNDGQPAAAATATIVTQLTRDDILLGRGAPLAYYVGNVRFREIVRARKQEYLSTGRRDDKQKIAQQIYAETCRRKCRFLSRVAPSEAAAAMGVAAANTEAWHVATEAVALEKIKQALRERPTVEELEPLEQQMARDVASCVTTKDGNAPCLDSSAAPSKVVQTEQHDLLALELRLLMDQQQQQLNLLAQNMLGNAPTLPWEGAFLQQLDMAKQQQQQQQRAPLLPVANSLGMTVLGQPANLHSYPQMSSLTQSLLECARVEEQLKQNHATRPLISPILDRLPNLSLLLGSRNPSTSLLDCGSPLLQMVPQRIHPTSQESAAFGARPVATDKKRNNSLLALSSAESTLSLLLRHQAASALTGSIDNAAVTASKSSYAPLCDGPLRQVMTRLDCSNQASKRQKPE